MRALARLLLCCFVFGAPTSHAAEVLDSVETRVKTLFIDPESQAPVVILETLNDQKTLPIWINLAEARAIALELEHVTMPRPLTHDLIRDLLKAMGAALQRVTITELRNNTYFARLSIVAKGQKLEIDSRPSDAIAVALRMKAPIYASAQVLSQAQQLPANRLGGTTNGQRRLGIQTQELTTELAKLLDSQHHNGVLVAEVTLGGAAMKAGLQRGDIIAKVNARAVSSAGDFEAALQAIKAPAKISLEVIKKGKSTTIVIDLPL